jgi:hypothetical protein
VRTIASTLHAEHVRAGTLSVLAETARVLERLRDLHLARQAWDEAAWDEERLALLTHQLALIADGDPALPLVAASRRASALPRPVPLKPNRAAVARPAINRHDVRNTIGKAQLALQMLEQYTTLSDVQSRLVETALHAVAELQGVLGVSSAPPADRSGNGRGG